MLWLDSFSEKIELVVEDYHLSRILLLSYFSTILLLPLKSILNHRRSLCKTYSWQRIKLLWIINKSYLIRSHLCWSFILKQTIFSNKYTLYQSIISSFESCKMCNVCDYSEIIMKLWKCNQMNLWRQQFSLKSKLLTHSIQYDDF